MSATSLLTYTEQEKEQVEQALAKGRITPYPNEIAPVNYVARAPWDKTGENAVYSDDLELLKIYCAMQGDEWQVKLLENNSPVFKEICTVWEKGFNIDEDEQIETILTNRLGEDEIAKMKKLFHEKRSFWGLFAKDEGCDVQAVADRMQEEWEHWDPVIPQD